MITKTQQKKRGQKEPSHCIQLASEALRLVFSRSEDTALLKAVSDKRSGKLRLQPSMAEKTIQDAEYKEEWRQSKEEVILTDLFPQRLDSAVHIKQFEKIIRKIQRVNQQFEDDPSDFEYLNSEVHLNRIMNAKIGPDTTYFSGSNQVSVPSASVPVNIWREQYSRFSKIFESCCYGEVIIPYNPVSLCVQQSRDIFNFEVARQWQFFEESQGLTSKKSKSTVAIPKKNLNNPKKILPEADWTLGMLRMLLDQNSETDRALRKFREEYNGYNGRKRPSPKRYDLVYKTQRARHYEKYPPVNPYRENDLSFKPFEHLQVHPQVFFDLENSYFEEESLVEDRVKVIYSCLIIQKALKKRKLLKDKRIALVLQKYTKVLFARMLYWKIKLANLRKVFLWQRLKHWYPLMVNKWRIRKNPVILRNYSSFTRRILTIQKHWRGYIERKKIFWFKLFYFMKRNKEVNRFYENKRKLWNASFDYELKALQATVQSLDELVNNRGGSNDVIHKIQRTEVQFKTEYLYRARIARLEHLDYNL